MFLSSDLVDSADDAYAQQKRQVEASLGRNGGTIVRLSKVLNPSCGILFDWLRILETGGSVDPRADYHFAPLSLNTMTENLLALTWESAAQKILLSGDRQISYFEAISFLSGRRGISPQLIKPIKSESELATAESNIPSGFLHRSFDVWEALEQTYLGQPREM